MSMTHLVVVGGVRTWVLLYRYRSYVLGQLCEWRTCSGGHYTGDSSNGGGFITETKADWLYVNYVAREQYYSHYCTFEND
jgi:hypothetical protein